MIVTREAVKRGEAVAEVVGWVQHVWDVMQTGRTETLQPDPFYPRSELITPEIIDKVIHGLEFDLFQNEIEKFPDYHNTHQGIVPGERLVRPGLDSLPPAAKRCLVEGLDRILKKYPA